MQKSEAAKNKMQLGGIKSARDKNICNLLKVKTFPTGLVRLKRYLLTVTAKVC
jgi:hypothetical protein